MPTTTKTSRHTLLVSVSCLTLLLSACGGGGGATPPPPPPANVAPVADIDATPTTGVAALQVAFDAGASSDSDGTIENYAWNFGDGNNGTGSTVQHTYAAAGNYTATLTVTDDDGDTDSATIAISVAANSPPVAVINADVVEGFAPLTVKFNGGVSGDSDGSIASHVWNFGNGTGNSAITAPTALFTTPGEYTVQLTVTDDKGATASTTRTVYVAAAADTFAIAGAFSTPDTAFADCDTAAGGTPGCNLNISSAQVIQSPSTVGGHASAASDSVDDYKLSLAGGEIISLAVADSNATNNLDLQLINENGVDIITQSSSANTARESITVPAFAGTYMVRVLATGGSSNYVLTVGTATTAAGNGEEFVEGEFIAHFSQLRMPWRIDAQGDARAAELGMDVVSGDADTPMRLRDRSRNGAIRRGMDEHTRAALRRLRLHPDVAWVELNRVRHPLGVDATDTYFPLQWNLALAHFPGAWQIDTLRGNGTIVAVIDTGILASHPDLNGSLVSGYDFVSEIDNANDGNGRDSNPADPGGNGIGRSVFHGTHVAGIVVANTLFAATAGNTGIAGSAPAAKVMPIRAIGRYGGLSSDIADAIRYAAGLSNSSGTTPAQRADVINLSIGSTGFSQLEQDAILAARAAGVIVVAAGGNSGDGTVIYPAAYAGVVGVGAVTLDRRRAAYSNTGAHIDITAPGGDNQSDIDGNGFPDGILSTLANDSSGTPVLGYDFYQGSSMAAPHVAAVAAMMKARLPSMTPSVFDSLLASGELTRDLGAGGRDDEYGIGLLDAEKALVATGTVTATPAIAVASPTRVGLGATTLQSLVVIDNGGGGSMNVTGVSDDQPWLTVAAQSVDASGLGSYRISVDHGALAAGNYSGTVTFNTSAGSLTVPVSMAVDATVQTTGAGTLYIVLWDPKQKDLIHFTGNSSIAPGTTTFNLTAPADEYGTKAGYQMYIGTDNDNDGLICDAGEACGAWLSLQEPKTFAHVRDRTDLSFNVGYSSTLGTLSLGDSSGTETLRGIPRR